MSITPVTPAENSKDKVKTWVNSQWKFRPKVGQFSVQLNTEGGRSQWSADRPAIEADNHYEPRAAKQHI
jgi:hypothetical protein